MHVPVQPVSAGYLEKQNHHPGFLATAVVLHIGIVAAVLAYNPEIIGVTPEPIEFITIAPPLVPPTAKPDQPKERAKAQPNDRIERQPVIVPLKPVGETWPVLPPLPPAGLGDGVLDKAEPPVAPPVLTGAGIDPRFVRDLQPPYPPSLERLEIEGAVTVRVQVGLDGRVTAVELVRADNPAFFASTRDWALKRWRFKPATRDGAPVATWLTKTVQFRIIR